MWKQARAGWGGNRGSARTRWAGGRSGTEGGAPCRPWLASGAGGLMRGLGRFVFGAVPAGVVSE
jgi:hypothetical protein